ncbi:MAG: cyclase family protein [Syntrophobacterales bacterium]|nr:cyclase family protein [Syntrophobacterales bacterium]
MINNPWIDVSLTLKSGMLHWPGDPAVLIDRVRDMDKADTVNLSQITMGAHSGTHIDAPAHFLNGERGTDDITFASLIGPARVIDIAAPRAVTRAELERHRIRRGERILLKTLNSEKKILWMETFTEEFVYVEADAADYLVARGVRTIGIDYLSIGGYKKDGRYVHMQLLGAGILIIEGLDLSDVPAGRYDMICLPIKISNGDGAPARVLLKKKGLRQ